MNPELLEILYFVTLCVYAIQCILAKKLKLNWTLIIFAIAVHSFYFFGWTGIVFLIAIALVSTFAELISLKTRFNFFGISYKYNLSHSIFSKKTIIRKVYPFEVTMAWILVKYLSFFLISLIFMQFGASEILMPLIGALVLVSFDLIIDPYAVRHELWRWGTPGRFFGVPWQNFFGWFVIGLIISFAFKDLKLVQDDNLYMTMPVLIISALFPMVLGYKLWSVNRILAMVAVLPLISVILLALFSVYW